MDVHVLNNARPPVQGMLASVPTIDEPMQRVHLDRRRQDGLVCAVAAIACDVAADDRGDHVAEPHGNSPTLPARTAAPLFGDGLERDQKRVWSGRGSQQLERWKLAKPSSALWRKRRSVLRRQPMREGVGCPSCVGVAGGRFDDFFWYPMEF